MRAVPIDENRSALMRRVRRQGTSIEESVGRSLRDLGAAYRKNVRALPGSPDFSNRTRGWAVFVNGCFWHGHEGCHLAKVPRHNRPFWKAKLDGNRERDARKSQALRELGLKVAVVWQCELANESKLRRRLARFLDTKNKTRESTQ